MWEETQTSPKKTTTSIWPSHFKWTNQISSQPVLLQASHWLLTQLLTFHLQEVDWSFFQDGCAEITTLSSTETFCCKHTDKLAEHLRIY